MNPNHEKKIRQAPAKANAKEAVKSSAQFAEFPDPADMINLTNMTGLSRLNPEDRSLDELISTQRDHGEAMRRFSRIFGAIYSVYWPIFLGNFLAISRILYIIFDEGMR